MKLKLLSLVASLVMSASVAADGTSMSWDFADTSGYIAAKPVTFTSTRKDYESVTHYNGTMAVTLTAWSDSSPLDDTGTGTVANYDGEVQQQSLYWNGASGWGVINNDEYDSSGNPLGSPDHSIDNYSHHGDTWSDLDMVMLDFGVDSEGNDNQVVLEGYTIGWQYSSTGSIHNDGQINGSGAVDISSPVNSGNPWSSTYNVGDAFIGTSATPTANTSFYAINTNDSDASRYWLVGLFNTMIDCVDIDAFKLVGITARTTTEVPEPASIAFFLVGLTMLYRRQQQQLKL